MEIIEHTDPDRVARSLSDAQHLALHGYGTPGDGLAIEWHRRDDVHERTERSLIRLGLVTNGGNTRLATWPTLLGQKVWWRGHTDMVALAERQAYVEQHGRQQAQLDAVLNGLVVVCRKRGCGTEATHRIVSIGKTGAGQQVTTPVCRAHSEPDLWPYPYKVVPLLMGVDPATQRDVRLLLAKVDEPEWPGPAGITADTPPPYAIIGDSDHVPHMARSDAYRAAAGCRECGLSIGECRATAPACVSAHEVPALDICETSYPGQRTMQA